MPAETPHRGTWILYLNGIEVPCPDMSVTYGVWQVPEATLNLPPHRMLERLGTEDRIDVAIFYLDDLIEPEKPQFRLLFEGEIAGWSYNNTPFGRVMSFQAIGDITIFRQIFFFFMNTVDAVTQYHTMPQTMAAPPPANLFYPTSLFYKGLLTVDKAGKPSELIKRPFELMYNIVRGMIDANLPKEKRTLPSVNFFSRWVRKRNFHNRFVSLPLFEDPYSPPVLTTWQETLKDKTKEEMETSEEDPKDIAAVLAYQKGQQDYGVFPIFKAAQCASAMVAVKEGLAPTVGESGSMMDVLREVLGKAYSEMAMIPTAPMHEVDLETGVITGTPDTEQPQDLQKPWRLANFFTKPAMYFGIPPMCNVVFPANIRSHQYQENYWAQPTRVYVNDTFVQSILGENAFTADAIRVGYPPEVNATIQAALLRQQQAATGKPVNPKAPPITAQALRNAKNILVFPEEFYKGPVLSRMPIPAWFHILMKLSKPRKDTGATAKDAPPLPAVIEGAAIHTLFEKYAEYEYYRQRYEKRGGQVTMVWNPYIVPGFSCAIFDTRREGLDTMGYVQNVTHSYSTRGRGVGSQSTTMSYGFGRTLRETLDLISDLQGRGVVTGNGPLDPVQTVREITHDFDQSETFFRSLFFGRGKAQTFTTPASFDFRKIIGYVTGEDAYGNNRTVVPFDVTPTSNNIPASRTHEIAPLPGREPMFNSFEQGMKTIARPICTLTQYILWMHPGKTMKELTTPVEGKASVEGPSTTFSDGVLSAGSEYPSAIYWARIKRLVQGPGGEPPAGARGVTITTPATADADATATPEAGQPVAVGASAPQTRSDWDKILEAYRIEMYSKLPQR